jgi:hypothetical protein
MYYSVIYLLGNTCVKVRVGMFVSKVGFGPIQDLKTTTSRAQRLQTPNPAPEPFRAIAPFEKIAVSHVFSLDFAVTMAGVRECSAFGEDSLENWALI